MLTLMVSLKLEIIIWILVLIGLSDTTKTYLSMPAKSYSTTSLGVSSLSLIPAS